MKKLVIAAFALIFLLPAAVSWSAVKSGAKCSNLGKAQIYKNYKFTCIKKNGKLVWSNGVLIPKKANAAPTSTPSATPTPTASATPTSTPTPTPSPTPSLKPVLATWEKALAEIERAYNSSSEVNVIFKFVISNDANKKFESLLKETIEKSARLWSGLYRPKGEFPVILGNSKDLNWVKREIGKYGHQLSQWDLDLIRDQASKASRGYVEVNAENAITFYVIGDSYDSTDNLTRSFISHEYVHSVQVDFYKSRESGIPRWAIEGSATFFGNAVASLMTSDPKSTYPELRRTSVRRNYPSSLALNTLTRDELFTAIRAIENNDDRSLCAEPKLACYTAGAILTEKLVADYGFEKFSNWWRLSSNKDWYIAFEEAFGINLDLWYQDFGIPYIQEVAQIEIPEERIPNPNTFTQKPKRLTDPIERWDATGSRAMDVFRKWGTSKADEKPKTPIQFYFGPNFWKDLEAGIRSRFESVVAYFDRYTNIEIPIYFMIGTKDDLDWICRLLESKDATRGYRNCVDNESEALKFENFGPARGFDLKNGSANFYLWKYKETQDMQGFKPRIEHEYFHSVQQNLLRNKFRTNIPCWFLEGGPEYFGLLTFSHGNSLDFLRLRRQTIVGAPERRPSTVTAADLSDWLTKASVPWQNSPESWTDNCAPFRSNGMYHDGSLATEWMIDRIGVDGVLALVKEAGETSWNIAFEKKIGLNVKEAYQLIGEYILKERKIAESNSWMSAVICTSSTLPGPNKNPPGCWFR